MLARAFQRLLVVLLTLVLLAVGLVLKPELLPTGARRALGIEAVRSRVVPPPQGSYAFMAFQPGSRTVPVTYSRCQTLHYVINPNGAPARFADGAFIRAAVAEISRVSGFRFEYDGTTRSTRTDRSREQGPILFDYAERPTCAPSTERRRSAAARGGAWGDVSTT